MNVQKYHYLSRHLGKKYLLHYERETKTKEGVGEREEGDAVIYYIDRKLGSLGGSGAPVTISHLS